MNIWMALDPRTKRISLQAMEFGDESLPTGRRGLAWQVRQGEINEDVYTSLIRGELDPDAQDVLHRQLWIQAGGNDEWSDDDSAE